MRSGEPAAALHAAFSAISHGGHGGLRTHFLGEVFGTTWTLLQLLQDALFRTDARERNAILSRTGRAAKRFFFFARGASNPSMRHSGRRPSGHAATWVGGDLRVGPRWRRWLMTR